MLKSYRVIPVTQLENVDSTPILCNYPSRNVPVNMTIVEAILTTCAASSMLVPTEINRHGVVQKYVSGESIVTNPVNEVMTAAYDRFGEETKVACLISLGAGRISTTNVSTKKQASKEAEFLRRVFLDGERITQAFKSRMKGLQLYHRFSVEQGLQELDIACYNREIITTHTRFYLEDAAVNDSIDRCVGLLTSRVGLATLEQLCKRPFLLDQTISNEFIGHSGGASVTAPRMPLLTRTFVARPGPMAELVDGMSRAEDAQRLLFISGMGGCGKTQIVLRYIKDYLNRYAIQIP